MDGLGEARAQLERAWALQLHEEYDAILWRLSIRLRRPLIRVEPMVANWGSWDPDLRTITISTRLIENYTWDIVVEVLRHEMAHQLATELFYARTPHGREFKQAAAMLGLPSWATKAGGELPDEIPRVHDRAVGGEEEKLLHRVEKLLALATSSNEHEAMAAMERVRHLYARHNLDRARSHRAEEMVTLVIDLKKKRIARHHSIIAEILGTHFFVRVLFGHQYDAVDNCRYRVLELLGSRENVLMAEYVHGFLAQQTEALWQAYRIRTKRGARSRTSYMRGVLHGFREKLERGSAEDDVAAAVGVSAKECKALMTVRDERLDTYVRQRYPRLHTVTRSRTREDQGAYSAGRTDGDRIVLNKGVDEGGQNRGRLLGASPSQLGK